MERRSDLCSRQVYKIKSDKNERKRTYGCFVGEGVAKLVGLDVIGASVGLSTSHMRISGPWRIYRPSNPVVRIEKVQRDGIHVTSIAHVSPIKNAPDDHRILVRATAGSVRLAFPQFGIIRWYPVVGRVIIEVRESQIVCPLGHGAVGAGVEKHAFGGATGHRAAGGGSAFFVWDDAISTAPESEMMDLVVFVRSTIVTVMREANLSRNTSQILGTPLIVCQLVRKHPPIRTAHRINPIHINTILLQKFLEHIHGLLHAILTRRPPTSIQTRSITIGITTHFERVQITRPVILRSDIAIVGTCCQCLDGCRTGITLGAAESIPGIRFASLGNAGEGDSGVSPVVCRGAGATAILGGAAPSVEKKEEWSWVWCIGSSTSIGVGVFMGVVCSVEVCVGGP